jgi:hypothetical protein
MGLNSESTFYLVSLKSQMASSAMMGFVSTCVIEMTGDASGDGEHENVSRCIRVRTARMRSHGKDGRQKCRNAANVTSDTC